MTRAAVALDPSRRFKRYRGEQPGLAGICPSACQAHSAALEGRADAAEGAERRVE
jgi:hypothetical protein